MDEFLTFVSQQLNENSWLHILTVDIVLLLILLGAAAYVGSRWVDLYRGLAEATNSIQKDHQKENTPKDYTAQVFKNPNIRYLLRTIRHDLQADRVTIYQYHNGEKSIAENPFLKVSCTHEVLGKDTLSIIDYMKDKQVDIFDGTTTKMFKDEVYKQQFVSDLHRDGDSRTLAQTLSRIGTTSIYMFPLKTSLGKVFGFGAVEYCCEPTQLQDHWLEWIQEKFSQVGALLAVDDLIEANAREDEENEEL